MGPSSGVPVVMIVLTRSFGTLGRCLLETHSCQSIAEAYVVQLWDFSASSSCPYRSMIVSIARSLPASRSAGTRISDNSRRSSTSSYRSGKSVGQQLHVNDISVENRRRNLVMKQSTNDALCKSSVHADDSLGFNGAAFMERGRRRSCKSCAGQGSRHRLRAIRTLGQLYANNGRNESDNSF